MRGTRARKSGSRAEHRFKTPRPGSEGCRAVDLTHRAVKKIQRDDTDENLFKVLDDYGWLDNARETNLPQRQRWDRPVVV
jgi:hypothetical protein